MSTQELVSGEGLKKLVQDLWVTTFSCERNASYSALMIHICILLCLHSKPLRISQQEEIN
jgi:hypothetical protein